MFTAWRDAIQGQEDFMKPFGFESNGKYLFRDGLRMMCWFWICGTLFRKCDGLKMCVVVGGGFRWFFGLFPSKFIGGKFAWLLEAVGVNGRMVICLNWIYVNLRRKATTRGFEIDSRLPYLYADSAGANGKDWIPLHAAKFSLQDKSLPAPQRIIFRCVFWQLVVNNFGF